MATTINAANISVGFDASKLKSGVQLSRNEISQLKRDMTASIDPVEKLQKRQESLYAAFKAGAINVETYSRTLAFLDAKIDEITKSSASMNDELRDTSALSTYGKGIDDSYHKNQLLAESFGGAARQAGSMSAGLKAIGVVGLVAGVALKAIVESMQRFHAATQHIDDLSDTVRVLGENYNSVKALGTALAEVGGMSFDDAVGSIKQLQQTIGTASTIGGKSKKLFEQLGLDPKELAKMGAVEAFDAVTDAIGRLNNASERAAMSMRIFGNERISNTLGAFANEFRDARKAADDFLNPMTQQQLADVGQLNDTIERIWASAASFKDRIYGELASGVNATFFGAAKFAESLEKAVPPSQELVDNAEHLARAEEEAAENAERLQQSINQAFISERESLAKRIETLKFGEEIAERQAKERAGWSEDQLRTLDQELAYLKKLEKAAKDRQKAEEESKKTLEDQKRILEQQMQKGEQLAKQFATPFQRLKFEIADLMKLLQVGAISQSVFNRAARAAANGASTTSSIAPTIQAGSREAYSFMLKQKDKAEQQRDAQLQVQQAILAINRDSNQKLDNMRPVRAIR